MTLLLFSTFYEMYQRDRHGRMWFDKVMHLFTQCVQGNNDTID
jgi:hypothetical protein